jgi:hypothetical protein
MLDVHSPHDADNLTHTASAHQWSTHFGVFAKNRLAS